MLDGQGVYRLGDSWYPVQTGDAIWMALYCPQWFVAMGKGRPPTSTTRTSTATRWGPTDERFDASRVRHRTRLTSELDETRALARPNRPPSRGFVFTRRTSRPARSSRHSAPRPGSRSVRTPLGNTFARWEGTDPELPAVGTGSHIDAIPHRGGTTARSACSAGWRRSARCKRAGFRPTRSIELLCSPARSRRGSASDAWGAGRCAGASTPTPWPS